MGYCSNCYALNKCPWICGVKIDEDENPEEPCFDREIMEAEIDPAEQAGAAVIIEEVNDK